MRRKIYLPGPHPLAASQTSLAIETLPLQPVNRGEHDEMRRTLIRYRAKPEAADKNAELVAVVFAQLKAAKPDGVRYLTLRLDDDSFVHLVETDGRRRQSDTGVGGLSGVPERHPGALHRTAACREGRPSSATTGC